MNIEQYISKFKVNNNNVPNYTRIGNKKLNIFGGSFYIPPEKKEEFFEKYKKHIFQEKKEAYFTEIQEKTSQILIDLDFRYNHVIVDRQHNIEHITDMVSCICSSICEIKVLNQKILCYIFEKPEVNTSNEEITKDGIHIIVNVKMDIIDKYILRNKLLISMKEIFDSIPVTNSIESIIDEGVMNGNSPWQLYGSKKPGNEAYELKNVFQCSYENEELNIEEIIVTKNYIIDNFENLTANNKNIIEFEQNKNIKEEYDSLNEKHKSISKPKKANVKLLKSFDLNKNILEIKNSDELDAHIDKIFEDININEHYIKETHEYTMCLTEEYYGEGSYNKWIKVGMVLKNTSSKLFLSWVKFSSQSSVFDWNDIDDLYIKWDNFNENDNLTICSLIYWCKECNKIEFNKINEKTVQKYIHYSFNNITDYDIANVLYNLYKESFTCVNIKNSIWYEFNNHRWEQIDSGSSLRIKISKELFEIYKKYSNNIVYRLEENSDEKKEVINKFSKLSKILKTANDKNNIMKEAKELYYDKEFFNKLDSNPYLLGCANCIVDIKNNIHREGKHEDYISMTTKNIYRPLSYYEENSPNIIEEINDFMNKLFPKEELREYMWEHLASCLTGTNENQTFNIYTGSGANGKSKLVELMQKVLGEYKGTIPSTLITQKRTSIGTTSSEVYQLIGKRYAVMQETSKGDTINEGIMKEITGGDPIQCRALFKDSVTFTPQFKLVVCTNTLFDIKSNDDGTWRRIRVCEFKSKFIKNPYNNPEFPVKDYPYQYEVDTRIDEKFKRWIPVFLSMLVNIVFKTKGRVNDRPCVLDPTNNYRNEQDVILEYCTENIEVHDAPCKNPLKLGIIYDSFKQWYSQEKGAVKIPPQKEIKSYFEKKYGTMPKTGWSLLSLKEN